jgi:hypothetical protein
MSNKLDIPPHDTYDIVKDIPSPPSDKMVRKEPNSPIRQKLKSSYSIQGDWLSIDNPLVWTIISGTKDE